MTESTDLGTSSYTISLKVRSVQSRSKYNRMMHMSVNSSLPSVTPIWIMLSSLIELVTPLDKPRPLKVGFKNSSTVMDSVGNSTWLISKAWTLRAS